jgi:hypothetical protein
MASVVRLARITLSLKDEYTVLRAFACLRESGIQPLVYDSTESSIWVAPEEEEKAVMALSARELHVKTS